MKWILQSQYFDKMCIVLKVDVDLYTEHNADKRFQSEPKFFCHMLKCNISRFSDLLIFIGDSNSIVIKPTSTFMYLHQK